MVEKIHHNEGEIISIKVETFEKPVIISACYRSPNSSKKQTTNLLKP